MKIGSHHTEKAKKKMSESQKGKTFSEEHKKRLSETRKGQIPPMKGKHHTEETRRRMSETHKGKPSGMLGKHLTKETKCKIGKASKCHWQNPEYARKVLAGKNPSKAERKLDAILQELFPGEFMLNIRAEIMVLGGKVPDFVNVNHKKQLIELYEDYWHDPKRFPKHQSPQDRIDYFKQFGDWDTLVVWEHELKDEAKLKQRLMNFCGSRL